MKIFANKHVCLIHEKVIVDILRAFNELRIRNYTFIPESKQSKRSWFIEVHTRDSQWDAFTKKILSNPQLVGMCSFFY